MQTPIKILVVDDDDVILHGLCTIFQHKGYQVASTHNGEEAFQLAQSEQFDVILSDLQLGEMDGLALIKNLNSVNPNVPIVLMTGYGSMDVAIRAMKLGAFDYVTKPFQTEHLLEVLEFAVMKSKPAESEFSLGSRVTTPDEIVGDSKAMQMVCKEIGRMASSKTTILIQGETGTGKELVARALHRYSERSKGPFVSVNCMAIPETLLESELFGFERGAFTGAAQRKIGRFEQAVDGTLFLDEIGDMGQSIQGKLLRALQEKVIQRIGGHEDISVDIRVVAASNSDLGNAVSEKRFREDLYYRLAGSVISLPALRERKEDVSSLVCHFLRKHAHDAGLKSFSISLEAVKFLEECQWPGNVRELQNVVGQALIRASGRMITREDVQQTIPSVPDRQDAPGRPLNEFVSDYLKENDWQAHHDVGAKFIESVERELYAQAFQRAEGNKSRLAKWLGVSRPTINEKLVRFGLAG